MAYISPMQDLWLAVQSVRPDEPNLVDFLVFLVISLASLTPIILLPLFHRIS